MSSVLCGVKTMMGEAVYEFDRSVQDTLQLVSYIRTSLPGVDYAACGGSLTSVAFTGSSSFYIYRAEQI